MSDTTVAEARNPTVYFIDDSATMREVMKIAFRRENIEVVAFHDASTAMGQIEGARPDIVITDVIMPDKDGYEVCQFVKQHPQLNRTPVMLMSGVVNRDVAERAFSVKADELIRKPFQPQDLIARVKQLLLPKSRPLTTSAPPSLLVPAPRKPGNGTPALSGVFGPPAPRVPPVAAAPAAALPPTPVAVVPTTPPGPPRNPAEVQKLRVEVLRLENLVKKLQAELAAERDYARALEAHVKTLQDVE